jgi:glycine/D-amino acid oxidase-like deaminating enzyme
VGHHAPGPTGDPDTIDRRATAEEESQFRHILREHIPDADGQLLALRVCMYTYTPDAHFVIDRHPHHENVTIAAGFSGHGFKFCSVMGEVLADLATDGSTKWPIGFLGLGRLVS